MTDQTLQAEDIQPTKHSPVLYKFTNQALSPELDNLLAMFYKGVYENRIGIMTAWNLETEQEQLILVGVELDENLKPDCYPLALVISAEQAKNFLAPDGKGGYFDPRDIAEASAAKDAMRPYDEAVVPAAEEPDDSKH